MLNRIARPLVGSLLRALRPRGERLPLSTWHLSRTPTGDLALEGVPLGALLDRWGSPLHVVDAARLDDNAADFLAVPPGRERGVEVVYSFKTNPVPGVLRRLRDHGIGAEVISPYELWLALDLGFRPEDIVYNGPAKSEASLRFAVERGIGLVNLNSRCEIAPFAAIARSLGRRPRVGVRVVPPGAWGGQLGERIDTGAALRAFTEAAQTPYLQVAALHAHLGGEIADAEVLRGFVSSVLAFTDVLRHRLAIDLEILDLGGSFASPTVRHLNRVEARLNRTFGMDLAPRAPDGVLSIRGATAQVMSLVEGHYRRAGRPQPRVILEPGRAMTGDAQMLLTRVVHVQDEIGGITHAVLDAGTCIASPVPNEWHQILPLATARRAEKRLYRLVGPICSPADVLYPSCRLPEIAPGDALAILDSGAYFVPFASSFSFPQPGIVMIDRGRETRLRDAETFQHMTALDVAVADSPPSIMRLGHGGSPSVAITT